MDLGISGKTAAVAASSAGLGLGTAKALAEDGVRVAISGRDPERLAVAEAEIAAVGEVVAIEADVSTPDGGRRFVEQAAEALGPLDILVPNAGGPPPGTFANTELDAYRAAIDMNLLSMVEMCRATIPGMQERGWGRVCAITSIGVKEPVPFLMASSVARAGLTSFLKITAQEVAADGVTVTSCQPGTHWTDRIRQLTSSREEAAARVPAGIVGDAYHFGQAVAFLCSEQAKFITGTGLLIDGGQSEGLLA